MHDRGEVDDAGRGGLDEHGLQQAGQLIGALVVHLQSQDQGEQDWSKR